jgi:hypothetical protein
VEVLPSALKHGVRVEDIGHAMRNAMAIDDLEDDLRLNLARAAAARYSKSSASSAATTGPSW